MAAPSFRQVKDEYWSLWQSMKIAPSKVPTIDRIAKKLIASKARYQAVSKQTGVPWAAIAIIHQMECGGDWRLSIAQGDPWNKISTHVPKGRGPFDSWEEAAIDALSIDGTDRVKQWGIERLCYELEKYNGFGSRNRGIHTPYLWSYSNHYTKGKYVADHVWSQEAVSQQVGGMPLLARMMALDPSITFGQVIPKPPDIEPMPAPKPDDKPWYKRGFIGWILGLLGGGFAGGSFTITDHLIYSVCALIGAVMLAIAFWVYVIPPRGSFKVKMPWDG